MPAACVQRRLRQFYLATDKPIVNDLDVAWTYRNGSRVHTFTMPGNGIFIKVESRIT